MDTDTGLQKLQRFAELGQITASLLHELSNPLTAAMLNLDLADQSSPKIRSAKRNLQLMRRYLEASRQQIRYCSKLTNFSLGPQLAQLKRLLLPLSRQAGVRLEIIAPPAGYKLYGDSVKFQQIIANLVINGIQAYEPGDIYGQASLVRISFTPSPSWLNVQVTDWGMGISSTELPKLFNMFYTTKSDNGNGLGIGLALVKQYVTQDFKGSISVSSSSRQGTRFILKLHSRQSN